MNVVFFKHFTRFIFPKALEPIKTLILILQKAFMMSKHNTMIKFITGRLSFNRAFIVVTFSVIGCCGYKVIGLWNWENSGTGFAKYYWYFILCRVG